MEDAVRDIVEQRGDGMMDMRRLAAAMAMRPDQRGPAIEASAVMLGMVRGPRPVDRLGRQHAGGDVGNGFEFP